MNFIHTFIDSDPQTLEKAAFPLNPSCVSRPALFINTSCQTLVLDIATYLYFKITEIYS